MKIKIETPQEINNILKKIYKEFKDSKNDDYFNVWGKWVVKQIAKEYGNLKTHDGFKLMSDGTLYRLTGKDKNEKS